MAHYYEDFAIGDVVLTPPRAVEPDDVMTFARVSGDFNPLHTDPDFARKTPMGQPVAHGLLVLSIATGLSADTGLLTGTALAFLGMDEWKFHAPVFFGDKIQLRWKVTDKRLASNGKSGVLKRHMEILKQDGTVVQSGNFTALVRTRGN